MAVVAFDTLKLADKLQAGGFTAEQARTAASAFAEAVSGADLATKADLNTVEAGLKAEIAAFRAEVKAEITALRTESKADLKAGLAETKSDVLRWMFAAMAAQTALIVGLVKLIH